MKTSLIPVFILGILLVVALFIIYNGTYGAPASQSPPFLRRRVLRNEGFQTSPDKKAMIIVEPREHPLLKTVLANFHKRMDHSWDLYIFHGDSNKAYTESAAQDIIDEKTRAVFIKSIHKNNLTADEYNVLFKDPSFWNMIDAEHILVFQTDAVTCKNSSFSVDDFLKYGYIGCSNTANAIGVHPESLWGGSDRWMGKGNMKDYPFYGVGGLSFRKKSFTLKCIRDMSEYPDSFPEDVFYSICVEKPENKHICPEGTEALMNFCTQGHSNPNKSWGAHKTNVHISKNDPFYEYCPEANILFEN
jgi:hypothetical protein